MDWTKIEFSLFLHFQHIIKIYSLIFLYKKVYLFLFNTLIYEKSFFTLRTILLAFLYFIQISVLFPLHFLQGLLNFYVFLLFNRTLWIPSYSKYRPF